MQWKKYQPIRSHCVKPRSHKHKIGKESVYYFLSSFVNFRLASADKLKISQPIGGQGGHPSFLFWSQKHKSGGEQSLLVSSQVLSNSAQGLQGQSQKCFIQSDAPPPQKKHKTGRKCCPEYLLHIKFRQIPFMRGFRRGGGGPPLRFVRGGVLCGCLMGRRGPKVVFIAMRNESTMVNSKKKKKQTNKKKTNQIFYYCFTLQCMIQISIYPF